jgi:hypothetical protein
MNMSPAVLGGPSSAKSWSPSELSLRGKSTGIRFSHPAHRSDITRAFVHRSFDHLLDFCTVLGRRGEKFEDKLCNAIILAEPQAPFLLRWFDSYRDFRGKGRGKFWNEHSVLRPAAMLAKLYPTEVTILSNRAFFWSLFWPSELAWIFSSDEAVVGPDSLATHL